MSPIFRVKEQKYLTCYKRINAALVAGDVISGGKVKTIEDYVLLHFEAASVRSFRGNRNRPFV